MPTWRLLLQPIWISRLVITHVNGRRRALKYVQMLGRCANVRHTLHCCRASTNHRYPLVCETGQAAISVTARVSVVPSARMKGVTLKVADALYGRQFGSVQWAIGVHYKARFKGVLSIGCYNPAALGLVPVCGSNQCL